MRRILSLVIVMTGCILLLAPITTRVEAQTPEVPCGSIIEGQITPETQSNGDFYDVRLAPGDDIRIEVVPVAQTFRIYTSITSPSGRRMVDRDGATGGTATVETEAPGDGLYTIWVIGANRRYIGAYTLFIHCTLADGTVIDADGSSTSLPQPGPQPIPDPLPNPVLFGFLGAPPVDFSTGIEIPLTLGQPQTAPIAGEVIGLYTYAATANQTATLQVSRVSGDISVGAAVINRDTNELIFLGGMPSSNNLRVEITFPTDGTYAIGIFVLDTPERTGTSGAVQVLLE